MLMPGTWPGPQVMVMPRVLRARTALQLAHWLSRGLSPALQYCAAVQGPLSHIPSMRHRSMASRYSR